MIKEWLKKHAEREDYYWAIYDEHAAVAATIRQIEEVDGLYEVEVPVYNDHYSASQYFFTQSLNELINFLELCKIKI